VGGEYGVTRGIDADVIVVGGGISGLASAWGLEQRGARVILLESAARTGGCIGTAREHGCLLESGPNSALETTPLIGSLLDGLGIAGARIPVDPHARNRYILREGKLVALPLSPFAFLTTPLFSTRAKLRLVRELFVGAGKANVEESVADFVRRRLGGEFLDYAINPFVGGVYAGDPEILSLSAAFPRLHELERRHGSLIRGQLLGARARARDPEMSKQSATMFAFQDGMQTLTDAIARRLARVELGAEVSGVTLGGNGCVVTALSAGASREFHARAVLLAVPAYAASKLVAPWAPQAAAALAAVPYPPVAVVHSAYRRNAIAHSLDGFGMLVPQCEHRQILGTIFSSTLFANRAPDGQALLTTFVGGTRQPELALLDEREISRRVQAEHAALLGVSGNPELVRVTRWLRAIPQYEIGHAKRVACVEEAERDFRGLYFCANYRGGIAIGDCIKSADRTAREVTAYLRAA
jgi:oxygen-dependent protoporphyrinogen oxidase